MNFQTPSENGYETKRNRPDLGAYLLKNAPSTVRTMTAGMFGYSVTRPVANKGYFYDVFKRSKQFGCELEAWHTESGPGVFEAVSRILMGNGTCC